MSADPRTLLAAYLRQRRELGERELFLEDHTEASLRALLARAGASAAGSDGPAGAAAVRAALEPPPSTQPQRPRGPAPAPAGPAGAPAPGPAAEEIARLPTLDALCQVALGCPRCRLAESRGHVVFGEGNPRAEVMVVGEAPGAEEDRSGRPFVGKAGRLLDLMLASVGQPRERVYVCNVLKCRPPLNRNPLPDEVDACAPYLRRQVELVGPRAILAFGTFAAQTLLGTDTSISRLRGRVHEYHGVPLIPTYHPAAALRNPSWVRATWEDLQRMRAVLAGA